MNIEDEIKRFIIKHFMVWEKNPQLQNDVSFLEKGIVDSTGVLELVTFLEETFHIKVEDEELVPENLDSVNNLLKFISHKLNQAQTL